MKIGTCYLVEFQTIHEQKQEIVIEAENIDDATKVCERLIKNDIKLVSWTFVHTKSFELILY